MSSAKAKGAGKAKKIAAKGKKIPCDELNDNTDESPKSLTSSIIKSTIEEKPEPPPKVPQSSEKLLNSESERDAAESEPE